ncbi:hypothetical protein D3C86_1402020 [compost metagenome]
MFTQELGSSTEGLFLAQFYHHTDHVAINVDWLHITVVVFTHLAVEVLRSDLNNFIEVLDLSFFKRVCPQLVRNDLHFWVLHRGGAPIFFQDYLRSVQRSHFIPVYWHDLLGRIEYIARARLDFVLQIFHLFHFLRADGFNNFLHHAVRCTNVELHVGVRIKRLIPRLFNSPGTSPRAVVSRADFSTVFQLNQIVRTVLVNSVVVQHTARTLRCNRFLYRLHVRFRGWLLELLLTHALSESALLCIFSLHGWCPHVLEHFFNNGRRLCSCWSTLRPIRTATTAPLSTEGVRCSRRSRLWCRSRCW